MRCLFIRINGIDELVKSNHNLIKFFYIQLFRKYHQKNIIFVIDMQSINQSINRKIHTRILQ